MSPERQCRFIAVVGFVLMAALPASGLDARPDYVNEAILDWEVPGLSITTAVATRHAKIADKLEVIPGCNIDNIPAGSIYLYAFIPDASTVSALRARQIDSLASLKLLKARLPAVTLTLGAGPGLALFPKQ